MVFDLTWLYLICMLMSLDKIMLWGDVRNDWWDMDVGNCSRCDVGCGNGLLGLNSREGMGIWLMRCSVCTLLLGPLPWWVRSHGRSLILNKITCFCVFEGRSHGDYNFQTPGSPLSRWLLFFILVLRLSWCSLNRTDWPRSGVFYRRPSFKRYTMNLLTFWAFYIGYFHIFIRLIQLLTSFS